MTQLMFETFNVSGLFVSDGAVLSLYALGKLTGCVIDIGHGKTGAEKYKWGRAERWDLGPGSWNQRFKCATFIGPFWSEGALQYCASWAYVYAPPLSTQ